MWRELLEDDDEPQAGRVGDWWEDFKGAVVRTIQPAVDVVKKPIEETAQRAAAAGAVGGAVAGALAAAGALALVSVVRGRRRRPE